MKITETELPGVLLIDRTVYRDARGFFMETWNRTRYAQAGLDVDFVQDNVSFSLKGVLRGLHYQYPAEQAKLVSVLQGEVFDVAVDIRQGSPSFGRWVGITLSAENARQMLIPVGFAHGLLVTSAPCLFSYKCSNFYKLEDEGSILWSDPDIGIKWPTDSPQLAPKDANAPRLADVSSARLPSVVRP